MESGIPRLSTVYGEEWLEQQLQQEKEKGNELNYKPSEVRQWAMKTLRCFGSLAYVTAVRCLREALKEESQCSKVSNMIE